MKVVKTRFIGIVLMLTAPAFTVYADKPVVTNFTLTNGLKIVSIYIPDSNNLNIFSFVPLGFVHEGPGQCQWSHLVEHMIIRTTIAPGDFTSGNAETMADWMHLDFYGNCGQLEDGLSHHAKWLRGLSFTSDSLALEKSHVIAETDNIAARSMTHKLAIAAWVQGFRHGLKHAALKDDVSKATLAQLQQYRDNHLSALDKIVVCVAGGIDEKILKAVLDKTLGKIKTGSVVTAEKKSVEPKNMNMTWDISARHLLLTWPIPDHKHNAYPALMAIGQGLNMKFFNDSGLKSLSPMVLAGVDLTGPEGNFFYISASVAPGGDFQKIEELIKGHLNAVKSNPDALGAPAQMLGMQLAYQLTEIPDISAVKTQARQFNPSVTDAMLEGNLALQWAMNDYRYGPDQPVLAKRLQTLDSQKIQKTAAFFLDDKKCSRCTLQPASQ